MKLTQRNQNLNIPTFKMIGSYSKMKLLTSYKCEQLIWISRNLLKNSDLSNINSKYFSGISKEQSSMAVNRRQIRIPYSWVQQINIKQQSMSMQIFFNSKHHLKFLQNKYEALVTKQFQNIIQRQTIQLQLTKKINQTAEEQHKALCNENKFDFHLANDQNEINNSDIKSNNSKVKYIEPQIAQINSKELFQKRKEQQEQNKQSLSIQNDRQNNQNKKNSNIQEVWTRSQQLKYVAFIITHEQLLQDYTQKFKLSRFSKYVTNGNKDKLKSKHQHYLEDYPGKTLSEIAQILIKTFQFTKEEVETEKQKALEYEAVKQKLSVTQCPVNSKFFKTLSSFPQHQFTQTHIQVNYQEQLDKSITCTKVNYRFIPCSESFKSKIKKWKYYLMSFEIELTIPSVQITPVFDQDNKEYISQNNCKQVKGFWISINGDRKTYFSKSQVIDRMKVIDIENKANEIEIIHSIWGENNQVVENNMNLRNKQDETENKQKRKNGKINMKKKIPAQSKDQSTEKKQIKNNINIATLRKDRQSWSFEEHLVFVKFLNIYEPAFLSQQQKSLGCRYFKVMSQYVKTKNYDQCYERFWILAQNKTFKQMIQKQSEVLQLDRQSIKNQLQQNIHLWIKNNPIVLIEKRERAKEYEIKQSLSDISDEKLRSLLNKVIQTFKIKVILNKDLEEDDLSQHLESISSLESSDMILKQRRKNLEKNSENKLNRSKIYSIIPLNWKDLQTKLLYGNMTDNLTENKHEETYKERKISLGVWFQMKIKQKQN